MCCPMGRFAAGRRRKEPGQDTDQRRAEQIEALRLVLEHKWSATAAAKRVAAERDARAEAAQLGIPIAENLRAELGDKYTDRRISRDDYTPDAEVIGAINPATGFLDLYTRTAPAHAARDGEAPPGDNTAQEAATGDRDAAKGPGKGQDATADAVNPAGKQNRGAADDESAAIVEKQRAETAAATGAQAHRRQACATLITLQPSNAELLKILVRQYLSGVAARSQTAAVNTLLRDWDATADGTGEKARNVRAWHRAVAAAELHTAELKDKAWDDDAVAHIELLVARVGYQPTAWEHDQLDTARA